MEAERCSRILCQIAAFTALVVGEEDKSSFIETFQKDNSDGWTPFPIGGRQGHCVRFSFAGCTHRFFKPSFEFLYRVGMQVLSMQAMQRVLFAQAGNVELVVHFWSLARLGRCNRQGTGNLLVPFFG